MAIWEQNYIQPYDENLFSFWFHIISDRSNQDDLNIAFLGPKTKVKKWPKQQKEQGCKDDDMYIIIWSKITKF